jgi:hypothetical protein
MAVDPNAGAVERRDRSAASTVTTPAESLPVVTYAR